MTKRPEFSHHAQAVLLEREIPLDWVWRAIEHYDLYHVGSDGNHHYFKEIDENDRRVLRVIVNEQDDPARIVTLFFDRRMRGKL